MKKMVSMRFEDYMIEDLEKNAKKAGINKSDYLRLCYWIAQEVLNTPDGKEKYEWMIKGI